MLLREWYHFGRFPQSRHRLGRFRVERITNRNDFFNARTCDIGDARNCDIGADSTIDRRRHRGRNGTLRADSRYRSVLRSTDSISECAQRNDSRLAFGYICSVSRHSDV
jgi:hypothetical protein